MKVIKSLYLSGLFFALMCTAAALFFVGFFLPEVGEIAQIFLYAVLLLTVLDMFLTFRSGSTVEGGRITADKHSNGDPNAVEIWFKSTFALPVFVRVLDELPFQYQERKKQYAFRLRPQEPYEEKYFLTPKQRGVYGFGDLNVFVQSPLRICTRRVVVPAQKEVLVYPSFIQMRKYELLAASDHLMDYGMKKIRKIGQHTEFEQIKDYVPGDDIRVVNWKATARVGKLMVNQYQDEKSQQVYALVDMGRIMKMPFDGMTLLDYAINASLAISNIALQKDDKAGVLTFSNKVHHVLPAARQGKQLHAIMEVLYNQQTDFLETDFERLYIAARHSIGQRSLLLLFTNFESLSGLKRQMNYIRSLAKNHLLVLIFFENMELNRTIEDPAAGVEAVYTKTIAQQFAFEKRLIVKELRKYGVHTIISKPQDLTVNTINKYLELKSRSAL